jgi:hypothetical protein
MDIPKIIKIFGGAGVILLFVFLILYSLNESPSRFIKYLLAYLAFFTTIGFLFYLFSEASIYIALLAGLGWIILIVKGSMGGDGSSPDSEDFQ